MSVIQGVKSDSAAQARSLYRQLLRQSEQFAAYNYREYAKRRTRDAFRENKNVGDSRKVQELIQKALRELQIMKRQTVVSQFYQMDRLVVEGGSTGRQLGNRNDIVRQKDTGPISLYAHLPRQPEGVHEESGFVTRQRLLQQIQELLEQPVSMAPGYRVNNQSRRTNRSYVDHDVFEGLPVRNWRREVVAIAPPPVHEVPAQKDKWDVEIPWGMPKDSQLLPQHSQDLLRAARSGRLYVRRPPVEEEEVEPEVSGGEKLEKREEDPKEKGFAVKTWKLVPRHLEGPEIEYLAKRRKGITGQVIKPAVNNAPSMTKATVRRTDAAGNSYVENVVLQQGQAIQGEVLSQRVIPSTSAEGAVSGGLPVQPTQPRRRHPAPKRKTKRGASSRRRRHPLPPTSIPSKSGSVRVDAGSHVPGLQGNAIGSDGIKLEPSATPSNENEIEDTEMGDDSGPASDDEGEEGSDDEGDGPGEGDEEETDQPDVGLERSQTNETSESLDLVGDNDNGGACERDISSSPDLPLARIASGMGHDHGSAGSPLKNVVTFASTYDERSPDIHSEDRPEAQGDLDRTNHADIHATLHGGTELDGGQDGYGIHPLIDIGMPAEHQDPHSNVLLDSGNVVSMQHDGAYGGEDEMLLDMDDPSIGHIDFNGMTSQVSPFPHQQIIMEDANIPISMPISEHDQQDSITAFDPHHQSTIQSHTLGSTSEAPPEEVGSEKMDGEVHEKEHHQTQAQAPNEKDSQDAFEDLLGSLEDHLDAHDQVPIPVLDRSAAAAAATVAQPKTPMQAREEFEVTATAVEPEEDDEDKEDVSSIPALLVPVGASLPANATTTDVAAAFVDVQAEAMNAAAEDYGVNFVTDVHVPGGSGAGAVFANVGSRAGVDGDKDGDGKNEERTTDV